MGEIAEAGEKIYLDYDQAELNRQYNQATLVPDNSPYAAAGAAATSRARERLDCELDISYGDSPDQRLDVYKPGNAGGDGGPVLIFVHGGAWRGSTKEACGGPASLLCPAGAVYVAIEFSLAPEARLDQMVAQVREAVVFVHANAASWGGDPGRMYVAGISSGAHLTSMIAVNDWAAAGLPADVIKGACMLSGPYDLVPVRLSARNDYLNLDEAAAEQLNPLRFLRPGLAPAIIGWGGKELDEFQRQGRDFLAAWRAAGLEAQDFFLPERNHFEMGQEYGNPESPVQRALQKMMGL